MKQGLKEWQGAHRMSAPVAFLNQPQVGLNEPLVASHVVPVLPPVCMITCALRTASRRRMDGACPSATTAAKQRV